MIINMDVIASDIKSTGAVFSDTQRLLLFVTSVGGDDLRNVITHFFLLMPEGVNKKYLLAV